MSTKVPPKQVSKLDKLRQRLSTIDTGMGSGFYGPKEGRNLLRILPPVGEMEFFFQPVGRHYFPPDGKKYSYCPNFTSDGELPCPICELVTELKNSGEKKLADELRIKRSFWMNVINRDDDTKGPLVYTPGIIVFSEISSLISDPDYGDITDINDGYDIIVEKSGTGRDTEYHVKPRPKVTPLTDDEDILESWLEKARDLSFIEVTDDPEKDKELSKGHAIYLIPYDRIVKEFKLDEFMGAEEDDADEEVDEEVEEEEEVPVKKHAVKDEVDFRRKRRAVRR